MVTGYRTDKLRESRLRWYGDVLCAEKGTVCKVGFDLDVSGKRPRVHPDQAHGVAKRRQRTSKADPATKRNKS
ncbi:hypothetical protein Y032_0339g2956 [Ancylostoma ceylanicum]|uniref:Uncharacterized protein n=1 Tax=Ancylostoma ceylanicum TaxID=53326 RepID=A0A016RXY8_9BILA|nr:hypothetical protein Y032_0339g2956 [Ancylostoma ceylanicum]